MTTTAVEVSKSVAIGNPEWLRVTDAVRLFAIGRSSLYALISEGRIKSASIRKRNAQRGVRLINRDSLAEFIESHASQH